MVLKTGHGKDSMKLMQLQLDKWQSVLIDFSEKASSVEFNRCDVYR